MVHTCSKTFGHDLGLSAVFRQWRAKSHCAQLHGYALGFKFTFGCNELDENGWVLDFGGLKPLKQKLVETFDHRLLVAGDDPELDRFLALNRAKIANAIMLPDGVGCEAFAKLAFHMAEDLVRTGPLLARGVRVLACECMEHGANSAGYHLPVEIHVNQTLHTTELLQRGGADR